MTPEQQVDRWVAGESVHNDDRTLKVVDEDGNVVRIIRLEGGECCPDFSCCRPELLAPPEVRRAFKAATEEQRRKFLSIFLVELIKHDVPDKKVHLVGQEEQA